MTTIPVEMRELLERLLCVIDFNGYRSSEVETVDELRALLADQPQARCDCAEGKCQQWFLASDEVGEECRAVYPTHGG